MKKTYTMILAAAMLAMVVGTADAGKGGGGKPGSGGGGGGVPTNYGCKTFAAGSTFTSSDGLSTKRLLISTYACYICDLNTHRCVVQSPDSLVGWIFYY
jgi:hypothetical protein